MRILSGLNETEHSLDSLLLIQYGLPTMLQSSLNLQHKVSLLSFVQHKYPLFCYDGPITLFKVSFQTPSNL